MEDLAKHIQGEDEGLLEKEEIIRKITTNYWNHDELINDDFWEKLGKRELIECFLRSDVTQVFNINNSQGNFYSIDFNKEDHKYCYVV